MSSPTLSAAVPRAPGATADAEAQPAVRPSPVLSAASAPRAVRERGGTTEVEAQLTVRRAMQAGGVFSLPVAAASQESTAEYAPTAAALSAAAGAAVAVDVAPEEVPTGSLPPPPAAAGKHKPRSGEYAVDEHLLTVAQVAERFATGVDVSNPVKSRGLTRDEAARRLKAYGPNRLSPPKQLPEILKFLKQFTDLLLVMLLVAAGLAYLGYGLNPSDGSTVILAGTLSVIVLLTGSINYAHERQTSNVLASITGMLPTTCIVVRDGAEQSVPAESLVLGDVVHLKLGNRVPADVRLVAASDLKVEMSSLTGEPDAIDMGPVKKSALATEARNLVFNSSLIMNGEGYGVVYRTGDDTYIGAIAGLAGATAQTKTSMQIEVEHTALMITAFAVVTAIILFIVSMSRGLGITYSIVYGFVLVLVANVPEGLPTTVISILALAAERMSEHRILIKRTEIIETLGSTTVICSDKTGTLTTGVMSVANIYTNRNFTAANKVRVTSAAAGAVAGTGSGRHGAADHAANMTIGRSLSALPDGTMVVVNNTTAGGGSVGARTGLAGVFVPPGATAAAGTALAALHAPATSPMSFHHSAVPLTPVSEEDGATRAPTTAGGSDDAPTPVAAAATALSSAPLPPRAPSRAAPSATAASAAPSVAASPALAGSAGGAIDRSLSLAQRSLASAGQLTSFASFYQFHSGSGAGAGSGASWARANAFTRLITIAAVCNRAQFAFEETPAAAAVGGEEGGPAGDGSSSSTSASAEGGAAHADGSQPLRGPLRKKRATGNAASAPAGGAPASAPSDRFRGDSRRVLGDASEAALLRYVDSVAPIIEFRLAYPPVHDVPFNSNTKTALAIARDPEDHGRHILMLKGAPEKVLERCSRYLYNGVERPIDADFQADFAAAYERFALMGERVLGFAYATFRGRPAEVYKRDETSYPQKDLVFCGLISLLDPPKPGVEEAIDSVRDAYIRVTMVTGDHPLTAEAIARKVGIVTLPTAREVAAADGVAEEEIPLTDPRVQAVVIAGYALPGLTPEQWDVLLAKEEVVFARTTPQQKLQIVEHYQRLGNVVAVTGDGTNDSPALKRANIGVAMGSASASDVAREAADVLILDDNFASIVHAIEMGRLVFDNLRKTIAYTLTHAVPELFPIFLTIAFGLPLALPGLLILTIDLLTEQTPAISLAYEPAEADIMKRPPRNMKTDRLVDGRLLRYSYAIVGLLETGWCLLSFFTVFANYGVTGAQLWDSVADHWSSGSAPLVVHGGTAVLDGPSQQAVYYEAVSAYYLTLILCQAWHVMCCKTRVVSLFEHGPMRNGATILGVLAAVFIGIFFVYLSPLQPLFNTSDLGGYWWLPQLGFAGCILAYTEMSKKLARTHPDGWWARWMQW